MILEENTVAITKEQFLYARPGQMLVDANGMGRKVLENLCSERMSLCLSVEHPELGTEEVFYTWQNIIADDDFGFPIDGLNHPDAHIADP